MPDGGKAITVSYNTTLGPFAGGMFGPGIPMVPMVPNNPPRFIDFPQNINANLRPRAYEAFGFPQLRAFANVELVRMAIETRKDQIDIDWQIKPIEAAGTVPGKAPKPSKDDQGKIDQLTKFWSKPDGVTPLSDFLRLMFEDLLAIDAPALEVRRTRGGQLIGLEVIPGDTIHPMVDDTGRRPSDPNAVAYQQVIKGVAWADLTNRDMLYLPRNKRPNHIYGFSPVEQIVVTINTIIRRQAMQLAHFTEGNVPAGLLSAPEGWTLDKIVDLQTWFDNKISGNTGQQAKLIWGPTGSKYEPFKAAPLKDEFDEWQARLVAFAFSLPPTPFIRQMNKGTAGEDQERALEEGLEPLKRWVKRWIDGVIQGEQGAPNLEFVWRLTETIDPAVQSKIDDTNVRNGTATIDEVRDSRGDDPLEDELGSKPMIYTTTGAMTLEQVHQASESAIEAMVEPPAPVHLGAVDPVTGNPIAAPPGTAPVAPPAKAPATAPKPAAKPAATPPATKLAKVGLISPQRPKARRAIASITKALIPILTKAGDVAAADVVAALKALKKDAKPGSDPASQAAVVANAADLSGLDAIADVLTGDLTDIASDSGDMALASVGVQTTDDLTNRVYQRAVDYAEQRAADLVSLTGDQSLIDSTRTMIRNTITSGLEDNIGADAIGDAIQASTAFSAARSELIAKTEIAMANGQGKKAGWQEAQSSGLTIMKAWQISGNDNCCDDCQANEAAGPIPLDDDFPSGDDMEPAHPNCACVVYSEASDGSDNGDTE